MDPFKSDGQLGASERLATAQGCTPSHRCKHADYNTNLKFQRLVKNHELLTTVAFHTKTEVAWCDFLGGPWPGNASEIFRYHVALEADGATSPAVGNWATGGLSLTRMPGAGGLLGSNA